MTTNLVTLHVNCPTLESAQTIATTLVHERLIACASIISGATSVSRQDGKVSSSSDVVMLCQTSTGIADTAIARTKALHPDAAPHITTLPLDGGDATHLRWIKDQLV